MIVPGVEDADVVASNPSSSSTSSMVSSVVGRKRFDWSSSESLPRFECCIHIAPTKTGVAGVVQK